MKKLLIFALVLGCILPVFAKDDIMIQNKTFQQEKAKGKLPYLDTNLLQLKKLVNERTDLFYEQNLQQSAELGAQGIYFDYEIIDANQTFSVIYEAYIEAGANGVHNFDTIVVDKKTFQLLNLQDLLGPHAKEISNACVKKEIANASDRNIFFTEDNLSFQGIKDNQLFIVNQFGNVELFFNRYELAAGVYGEFRIPILLNRVHLMDLTILQEGNQIGVRNFFESIGYEVFWEKPAITIKNKNTALKMKVNGDDYFLSENKNYFKEDFFKNEGEMIANNHFIFVDPMSYQKYQQIFGRGELLFYLPEEIVSFVELVENNNSLQLMYKGKQTYELCRFLLQNKKDAEISEKKKLLNENDSFVFLYDSSHFPQVSEIDAKDIHALSLFQAYEDLLMKLIQYNYNGK